MFTLFIDQFFPARLIKAISWTLVHSLWQGLLLTIVAGILILLTRRSGAESRYALFSGLFLLFLTGAGLTFAWQWNALSSNPLPAGPMVINSPALPLAGAGLAALPAATPVYQQLLDRFSGYFNEHAALIVTIWFIVFSAKLVRILAGLGRIHRIRHYRTQAPGAWWSERVDALARSMGIRSRVVLMGSELIKVPVMTGMVKPAILLPVALLSQLPVSDVEAILLHELAHIRRRDYFVNLIQSFAEILFFFNPGVWWVSSLIREERENCCDDMAVRVAGSKKEFINALVAFQEHRVRDTKYAIAFHGSGNHLLQRVKRIIYRDNKMLDGREKVFFGCSLLIVAILLLTFAVVPPARGAGRHLTGHEAGNPVGASARSGFTEAFKMRADSDTIVQAIKPTSPVKRTKMVRTATGSASSVQAIPAENAIGKESAIMPDTIPPKQPTAKPISPNDGAKPSKPMTPEEERAIGQQKADWDMHVQQWRQQQEEWKVQADKWKRDMEARAQDLDDKARNDLKMQRKALEYKERELEAQERELQAEHRRLDQQRRKLDMDAMHQDKVAIQKDKAIIRQKKMVRDQDDMARDKEREMRMEDEQMERGMRIEDGRKEKVERDNDVRIEREMKIESDRVEHAKREKEFGKDRVPMEFRAKKARDANDKYISPITRDLMGDKLIPDPSAFSFELTGKYLKVNGEKQPKEIYQRYKDRYIHNEKDVLKYEKRANGGESTTINVF